MSFESKDYWFPAELDAAQFAWGDVEERCVYVCLYVYAFVRGCLNVYSAFSVFLEI